ncbi:tRNA (guanine-N(1)-)-methyltransferase [Operophtera brumata]|uniref:tRNA (Guanine-N(1)-)-methyltransferase n=1 Tax=Operophtera brumata TaxID=104452 RepID=A0A0L7LF29_OPEBR|nr:tRNA (guanine-N(1)-)-methyltransferase [Operophtera brumata]
MNFIAKPLYNHAKLLMLLSFALAIILTGVLLRFRNDNTLETDEIQFEESIENESMTNANSTEPRKTRRKEYLYRLLTNTTRSLIQMEIKARRLEENMRRIKEKTADILWKNKDKALWHILFKNISRHISIRHEFHQHASLRRIMQDSHKHVHNRRRKVFLSR